MAKDRDTSRTSDWEVYTNKDVWCSMVLTKSLTASDKRVVLYRLEEKGVCRRPTVAGL